MSVWSQPRYVVEPMEVSGCWDIFETFFFSSTESRTVRGSVPHTRAVPRESKFQNSNPRTNGFQNFFLQKLRFSTGRTGRTVGATAAVGCLPDRIRRALYGKHGGVVVRSTVWILAFFKSAQNHLSATLRKQPIILSILTSRRHFASSRKKSSHAKTVRATEPPFGEESGEVPGQLPSRPRLRGTIESDDLGRPPGG